MQACLSSCVGPTLIPVLHTELVVAESVVVIKKLLQMQPAQHGEIIKHLAKLTDNIQVRTKPRVTHTPESFPYLNPLQLMKSTSHLSDWL